MAVSVCEKEKLQRQPSGVRIFVKEKIKHAADLDKDKDDDNGGSPM